MTYFLAESISLIPDGTVFLHIGIIALMVYVLNRTLFKPITEILERREKRMSGAGTGSASDLLQQVEDKTRHYENSLRAARSEGYQRIEQERTAQTQARQSNLGAMREEISETLASEKNSIGRQVAESRIVLQRDAQRLAQEISTRILGRAVNG